MTRAPAFSLSELLVVLTILGLLAALSSGAAPNMFANAALKQSASRLSADLEVAAIRARSAAAFGAIEVNAGGREYRMLVDGRVVVSRALQAPVRLGEAVVVLDPAGRWRGAPLILESDHARVVFEFDPATGSARRARDGAARSAGRLSHLGERHDHVLGAVIGVARRSRASARRSRSGRARARTHAGSQARPARRLGSRPHASSRLGPRLPTNRFGCELAAHTPRVQHIDCSSRSRFARADIRERLGGPKKFANALSLFELTVALTVLGLSAGLAFTQIGPWLSSSANAAQEANLLRSSVAVNLTLNEITAGLIDPAVLQVAPDHATFRVLSPTLAPLPFPARLQVDSTEGPSKLLFIAPDVLPATSILVESQEPLRLRQTSDALLVEAQTASGWRLLLAAPILANAPLVCGFDAISRSCR